MGSEKKKKKMGEADLVSLLHSSLFSMERALQEIRGKDAIIVGSHAAKFLGGIEEQKGSKTFTGKSTEEAVKKFVDFASGSEFFNKIEFEKLEEDTYVFRVVGCKLAKSGVHEILDPKKDICPMAIVGAAVLKHNRPMSDVIISSGKYTDDGSETEIFFVKY